MDLSSGRARRWQLSRERSDNTNGAFAGDKRAKAMDMAYAKRTRRLVAHESDTLPICSSGGERRTQDLNSVGINRRHNAINRRFVDFASGGTGAFATTSADD